MEKVKVLIEISAWIIETKVNINLVIKLYLKKQMHGPKQQ